MVDVIMFTALLRSGDAAVRVALLTSALQDAEQLRAVATSDAAVAVLLELLAEGETPVTTETPNIRHLLAHHKQFAVKQPVLDILQRICAMSSADMSLRVLRDVLELLRRTEKEKLVLMLLQFLLCVSKSDERPVRLFDVYSGDACLLMQFMVLKHDSWKTETVSLLLELITRVANESAQSAVAMHINQVESVVSHLSSTLSADNSQLVRARWQSIKLWDLGASPAEGAAALRNGSPPEQGLLLHCLQLSDDKSPCQQLLQLHNGAAILGDLVTKSPYALKKLVIEFAQNAVKTLDAASRTQLIEFQTRYRRIPLLSTAFLETLDDYQYVIRPEMECLEYLEVARMGTNAQIREHVDKRFGMDFSLCIQRGILRIILERMRDPDEEDALVGRMWWLLLYILKRTEPYEEIAPDEFQFLVTTLLYAINPVANKNRRYRTMAANAFYTKIFHTPKRAVIVASGGIPILVRALGYETTPDAIGKLTDVALVMSRPHPAEVDEALLSLLEAEASPGEIGCAPLMSDVATISEKRTIYFQNFLVLFSRDRFAMRYGKFETAEERVNCARVAIQVLGKPGPDTIDTSSNDNSRMAKRLALHMLHEYLELDTLDPLQFFDSRDDIREIAKLLRENLELLVRVIVEGPEQRGSKQLARRLLTALAASDPTCHKQIRELQQVHQAQPGFVRMELLVDVQTQANEFVTKTEAADVGHKQDGFQYSDGRESSEKMESDVMDDEPKSEDDSDSGWEMVSADTNESSFAFSC